MNQSVYIPELVFHTFFGIESHMYEMDFPFAPTPQVEKSIPTFSQAMAFFLIAVCSVWVWGLIRSETIY